MRQYGPDVNLAPVVVDRSDQARFVSTDIEHRQIAYSIGIREYLAQAAKRGELLVFHQPIPVSQGAPAIWMLAGEVIQAFVSDDVH